MFKPQLYVLVFHVMSGCAVLCWKCWKITRQLVRNPTNTAATCRQHSQFSRMKWSQTEVSPSSPPLFSLWWHTQRMFSNVCFLFTSTKTEPSSTWIPERQTTRSRRRLALTVFLLFTMFSTTSWKKTQLEVFICWDVWKLLSKNQKCLKSGTWWLRWNRLVCVFFCCKLIQMWVKLLMEEARGQKHAVQHRGCLFWCITSPTSRSVTQIFYADFLKCFYRWILIFCHRQLRDQRKHHPTHSKQTPD